LTQLSSSPQPRVLLVCPENLNSREAMLAAGLAAQTDLTILLMAAGPKDSGPGNLRIISLPELGSLSAGERPEFIVYASPPTLQAHWKIWCWKRFRAPGALLGGYWRHDAGSWPARLARQTVDFFLTGQTEEAASLEGAGVHRRRVLFTGQGAESPQAIVDFLARRRAAEDRSVLWVDEDISLASPSTKHLVYSLPHLREAGWEVRTWCLTSDLKEGGVETQRFPAVPGGLRILTPYWFPALANLYGLGRQLLDGRPPARIVQTVGGAYLGADISAIHFVNHLWLRRQIELGSKGMKARLTFFWTLLGVLKDQLQFSNPRCRLFLPVSDSIAADVRQRCQPDAKVEVLPNSYDETRFNPEVRYRMRAAQRLELGFTDENTVFCFASQGHYQRKGFWLAVEALARLRRREGLPAAEAVKFLVIGGQPATLERLRAKLALRYPDWERWIVFAGNQPAVENFFAAADAFLLPSYFEAFCLAEIEAGALGLPLLLTPHYGTEMILRPGENGLSLPFDPAGIEEVLARFLAGELPAFTPSAGRALDRPAYARELGRIYQQFLGSDLPDPPPHG
jgi:glycosyltransferase involved in cell wall biosynthesis